MKITREEFKELVELSKRIEDYSEKVRDYFSDDVMCDLAYPALYWIVEKLGLDDEENFEVDLLFDLYKHNQVPIDYEYNDSGDIVDVIYSNDLDKIYDVYLGDK